MKQKFSTIGLLLALLLSLAQVAFALGTVGPLSRYRYVLRNIVTDDLDNQARVESYIRTYFDEKGVREGLASDGFTGGEQPLYIDVELLKKGSDQSSFSISFFNSDEERLYYRFENVDIGDFKKSSAFDFLGKELENFVRTFSREGRVTGIDDKRVSMELDKELRRESLVGKSFQLFCVDNSCREIQNFDIEGIITEVKGTEVLGHFTKYPNDIKLFNLDITGLRVHIQDQKQYQNILGEKEILITEKNLEFNPQFKRSFKACAVLPFTGSFENLEQTRILFKEKMANDARCVIKDDENFYHIFRKYRGNLATYLQNRSVIKTVAEKVQAGSIFRINVDRALGGVRLSMDVVSENGADVFFKERTIIDEGDYKTVVEVLYQWMIRYVRSFPYDAKVIENAEEDILFDLGLKAIHSNNQLFEIYRPTKVKIVSSGKGHRVEWEKKRIARGIVDRVQAKDSIGRLIETDFKNLQVRRGDWVKLVGADAFKKIKPVFAKHNLKTDRKTGRFKLAGDILLLNSTFSGVSNSQKFFSVSLGLDYYLPYGFIFSLDSERNSQELLSFDLNKNTIRAGVGYALVIEGNLFVSLVDVYLGYTNNFLELSSLNFPLLGDLTLTGPYSQVRAKIPLYENSNLHIGVIAAPVLEAENTVKLLGESKNGAYYGGFVDFDYKVSKNWNLFGEILLERNSYETEIDSVSIGISTTKFRIGAYWNF